MRPLNEAENQLGRELYEAFGIEGTKEARLSLSRAFEGDGGEEVVRLLRDCALSMTEAGMVNGSEAGHSMRRFGAAWALNRFADACEHAFVMTD